MPLFFSRTTIATCPNTFFHVKSQGPALCKAGLKVPGAAFALALVFSCSAMADQSPQSSADGKPKLMKVEKLKAVNKVFQKNAIVNINTATASELSTLINIGFVKAQEIVAYRKAHGNFVSIDQLAKVKGIGTNTIEQNRKRIQVASKAPVKK
jgi:competence protein ComEA